MKNLSLINNVWIERINPNITTEERVILENITLSPNNIQIALMENIKTRSSKLADSEDANSAQTIYDQHKLAHSNLISADITLPNGHGIINCRVNNEHKQIRF